jgi:hypothetical protein
VDEDQGRRQRADGMWRAYSVDTTIEGARRLFEQRYGAAPASCFVSGPVILAGPLPEGEAR